MTGQGGETNKLSVTIHKTFVDVSESYVMSPQEVAESTLPGIKAVASNNVGRGSQDLMFIRFILLHEGGNLNGDFFIREELERMWDTFVAKPITWEHGQPYIGYITDSRLVRPSEDGPDPRWYIECAGVVWKARYPELAYAIAEGGYRTSVEVYFSDALYAIGDIDKLYTADEAPFLVDLRGKTYRGEKVWRVLLGCLGGGAGIVEDPADVDALILEVAKKRDESLGAEFEISKDPQKYVAYAVALDTDNGEKEVETVKDVKDELVKYDETVDDVAETTEASTDEEVDNEAVESAEASEGGDDVANEPADEPSEVEQLRAEIASLREQLEQAEKAYATLEAEFNDYKAQIEQEKIEAAKDALAEGRLKDLEAVGAKVPRDKWFGRLREMDDETFADLKELLAGKVTSEVETSENKGAAKSPEASSTDVSTIEAKADVEDEDDDEYDEEDDLESEAFASKPNLQFNMEQVGVNETLLAKFENMWREMLSK